jgi:hypothetical protein
VDTGDFYLEGENSSRTLAHAARGQVPLGSNQMSIGVEGVDAPLIAFPPFSLLLRTLRSISLRTAYLFCTYIRPNITLLIPNYEHPRDQ